MSAARTEKGRRLSRLLVPSFGARMMLPALLLLAALSIFPFLFIVWMSFNDVSPIGGLSFDWVGLENWRNLFTDPDVR
jgi:multiple sugar transport system permease protein